MHVNGWDDYILQRIIKNQFEIEYDILALHLIFEHEVSTIYTIFSKYISEQFQVKVYTVLIRVTFLKRICYINILYLPIHSDIFVRYT